MSGYITGFLLFLLTKYHWIFSYLSSAIYWKKIWWCGKDISLRLSFNENCDLTKILQYSQRCLRNVHATLRLMLLRWNLKYQTLHSKRTFQCWIFFVKNNSSIFCRDILRETIFETVWLTKLSLCHAGSTRDKILPGLPAILAGFPACLETGDVSFCMRDLIITIA